MRVKSQNKSVITIPKDGLLSAEQYNQNVLVVGVGRNPKMEQAYTILKKQGISYPTLEDIQTFLKIKVKIRWEGNIINKLAKKQFTLLLIRTILLQGTKLVFLLSLGIAAFHGWQYLGSTIYFSVKDTKGNLTKPEMFSHAFPTISMIFFLGIFAYMISLKINNDEAFDVLIEKTSKKMFSIYLIGGLIGLGTLPVNQFGQQMENIVIAMMMYLFIRRIVELENEKLRKSIFPLYKTNGAFEEIAWRLNSEWYRYLKPVRLKCEKKKLNNNFYQT